MNTFSTINRQISLCQNCVINAIKTELNQMLHSNIVVTTGTCNQILECYSFVFAVHHSIEPKSNLLKLDMKW